MQQPPQALPCSRNSCSSNKVLSTSESPPGKFKRRQASCVLRTKRPELTPDVAPVHLQCLPLVLLARPSCRGKPCPWIAHTQLQSSNASYLSFFGYRRHWGSRPTILKPRMCSAEAQPLSKSWLARPCHCREARLGSATVENPHQTPFEASGQQLRRPIVTNLESWAGNTSVLPGYFTQSLA